MTEQQKDEMRLQSSEFSEGEAEVEEEVKEVLVLSGYRYLASGVPLKISNILYCNKVLFQIVSYTYSAVQVHAVESP